jgi:hypothetical protein
VSVAPTKPRSNSSSTKFSKGNEHRFEPGVSGNPGGKPKSSEARLLSKAMRVQLSWRAPNEVATQLGLEPGASWAQCISMRLIRLAIREGDVSAMRELREATEGTRSHASMAFTDEDGNPQDTPPLIELVFVQSDGNGYPVPGYSIDGKPAMPSALPAATRD